MKSLIKKIGNHVPPQHQLTLRYAWCSARGKLDPEMEIVNSLLNKINFSLEVVYFVR